MPLSQSWQKSGRLFPIYYHKTKTSGSKSQKVKMQVFVLPPVNSILGWIFKDKISIIKPATFWLFGLLTNIGSTDVQRPKTKYACMLWKACIPLAPAGPHNIFSNRICVAPLGLFINFNHLPTAYAMGYVCHTHPGWFQLRKFDLDDVGLRPR